MKLRTYQDGDREALIALWQRVFPDDPPHNDPSQMIAAKRAVDDLYSSPSKRILLSAP